MGRFWPGADGRATVEEPRERRSAGWAQQRMWGALYGAKYSNDHAGLHRSKSARPRGRTGARAAACTHALNPRGGREFTVPFRPVTAPA